MDFFIPSGGQSKDSEAGDLKWWQLSLIGVGCTIGTGFFLGSAIGIKITGPSIILSFVLAALGTYIVYSLLAKMTAEDPQDGSFCYYANKAYGRWAGFSCGWNYWCSNILIMGSQLTALIDSFKILVSKCSSLALCNWIRHSLHYCRFNWQ